MKDKINISLVKTLLIIVGFPLISFLISLLLLNKDWFTQLGIDFFTPFWAIITFWYLLQIGIVIKVLKSDKLGLKDIGYTFGYKKTIGFITAYLIFAFILLAFVEFALASANITSEDINSLSDLSNITPLTTTQRIIFIFAGLVGGIAEEFVYRGYAIQALEKYNLNKWIAVLIAAIPFVFQHGIKSIDQFWWFFIWGIILGGIFIFTKRKLYITIIIHWIVILTAILAILQLVE